MIDNIYKNIGIEQPDVVDLLRDVQEHPKTWDVYKNGNTLGVNQVEQEKTAVKCQRYQPKNISELSYFVAAVRPGFATMLDRFLNREDFKYGIPILDKLLSNADVKGSYLAFQEQIMVVLQRGGLTGSESYKVIKAISKKKEKIIKSYYEKFSKGFVEYLISTGSDEESAKHATDACWKVILDSAQYMFNSAHAVAMALDSLYVAYPKMYWPIETYTALLNIYNDRGDDKDKIERCKNEMFDVAGIKCVPCQFRKDNKKFTYDKEKNVIYDVLGSMKGMPKATEQIMSKYADQPFELFTDLLYELFKNGDLKPATIETLIQADYFSEFGKNGKLLQVFYEFTKRKHKISKQLKDTTIETRYVWLRENERMIPDESLDIQSQLLFETSVFGNPKTLKKECRGWYFVTELSEKFPKIITMYRVDTGTVGQMKMAKKTFEKDPLVVGDMFKVVSYNTSPAYRYKKDPVTGESIRTVDSTKKDLWLNSFTRVAE